MITLAITACGGADNDDLGAAFCADLTDGMAVAQLAPSIVELYGNDNVAGHVFAYVEGSCPEQLADNEELRNYLDANGIDPDG